VVLRGEPGGETQDFRHPQGQLTVVRQIYCLSASGCIARILMLFVLFMDYLMILSEVHVMLYI
jgi:hypothetical protein